MIRLDTVYALEEINKGVMITPMRYIESCERAFRDQVRGAADRIAALPGTQLVMLAGPSSSGKTTTAQMLQAQFQKQNRKAWTISLDDFYLTEENEHFFEDGTPDYETVHSLDIKRIQTNLEELLRDKQSLLPRFNFLTKSREDEPLMLSIDKDDIIIVEGLHALNPLITDPLDGNALTKLYVSVSSRISMNDRVLLTRREMRFIRRLLRDERFRDSSPEQTFYLWGGVRKGEDRYLYPFRSLADLRMDSTHPYAPCVFKREAIALLDTLDKGSTFAPVADVLRTKLQLFTDVDPKLVPDDSLLHEFIG